MKFKFEDYYRDDLDPSQYPSIEEFENECSFRFIGQDSWNSFEDEYYANGQSEQKIRERVAQETGQDMRKCMTYYPPQKQQHLK